VLKKRVDAARQMLLNDPLASAEEIAMRVDLPAEVISHSHFDDSCGPRRRCSGD
jgi:hypothetical protein